MTPILARAIGATVGGQPDIHGGRGLAPLDAATVTFVDVVYKTKELLAKVGLKESPDTLVTHLGVGKQQLVEIAKALAHESKLLVLDEPLTNVDPRGARTIKDQLRARAVRRLILS